MLGAVCHDLGKPATTAMIDGRVKSPGHEAMGVGAGHAILDRLNVNTLDGFDVRAQVLGLVAEHLRPSAFFKTHGDRDGRRVPPPRAEGRSGIARALRARGLSRPRRHVRLLGDGLVYRTRARRSASSTGRRRRS